MGIEGQEKIIQAFCTLLEQTSGDRRGFDALAARLKLNDDSFGTNRNLYRTALTRVNTFHNKPLEKAQTSQEKTVPSKPRHKPSQPKVDTNTQSNYRYDRKRKIAILTGVGMIATCIIGTLASIGLNSPPPPSFNDTSTPPSPTSTREFATLAFYALMTRTRTPLPTPTTINTRPQVETATPTSTSIAEGVEFLGTEQLNVFQRENSFIPALKRQWTTNGDTPGVLTEDELAEITKMENYLDNNFRAMPQCANDIKPGPYLLEKSLRRTDKNTESMYRVVPLQACPTSNPLVGSLLAGEIQLLYYPDSQS